MTASISSQLDALANDWLAASTRSPATKRAYWVEIRRLQTWLMGTHVARLMEMPSDSFREFLDCLVSESPLIYEQAGAQRQLKPSSALQSKRILSALLLWGAERGRTPIAVVTAARNWAPNEYSTQSNRTKPRRIRSRRLKMHINQDKATVRRDFARGLAYWLGAGPAAICNLRSKSVSIRHGTLVVRLPDGSGNLVRSYGPPELAECWKKLKEISHNAEFAVRWLNGNQPVSISTIARILSGTGGVRENSRSLRHDGILHYLSAGWDEAEIRRQYRRQALPQIPHWSTEVSLQRRAKKLT